jgi:hypothetical protein
VSAAAAIRSRLRRTDSRLKRLRRTERALERLNQRRRRQLTALAPGPTVMYDSVTLSAVPRDAPAVAGYVGGHWPTYRELGRRFPHARHLSIAVNAGQDAECLDVEPGDATPDQVVAWYRRQRARGVHKPVIYTSVSAMPVVLARLAHAGIPRQAVRLWAAHYTGRAHLCGPTCGYGLRTVVDATQWTNRAQGRNLDESHLARGFWA